MTDIHDASASRSEPSASAGPPSPSGSASSSRSTSPDHSLDLPSLQPLSHSHPLLTGESFDADQFLLSRLHIPLEELRGELRGYLGELREELVRLINEDYEEFISLGTGLRGEEQRLKRLGKPLKDVRGEVESVRDVLAEHQLKVQSKLDERAALREEKALLDLLQRLFDTLTRAEKLLDTTDEDTHTASHQIGSGSDASSSTNPNTNSSLSINTNVTIQSMSTSTATSATAKMVNRVAGEYTQVVYLANKARLEGCEIVDVVQERIENIKSRLSKDLSTLLVAELDNPNLPRLKQCLKTYELIEGWEEAEEVFRSTVRSFCQSTITSSSLLAPTTPVVPITPHPNFNPLDRDRNAVRIPSDSPLASLYNRILTQVEIWSPILRISSDISDRFDFFSAVIWPEIASSLIDKLGSTIFAAGRPDELHKHYTTTHAFITALEFLAPSAQDVLAMRSSTPYGTFERRWQLPVYFQLRWKEIVGNYEVALNTSSSSGPAASDGGAAGDDGSGEFTLSAVGACWKALRTAWSEEVFIPELAPRFWRLSLQIVSRLGTHLKTTLDTFHVGEEDTAQEDAALRFTASVISDSDRLGRLIGGLEVVNELELRDQLSLSTAPYSDLLLQILTRRCVDPLKLIRSIASQFRASSSSPNLSSSATTQPSARPSYFIPSVFKPIHTLFSSRPGAGLKETYSDEWSTKVTESVFINYATILSSVRKTEDLLRKHRKSKKTAAGGVGGLGLSSFFGGGASNTNTNTNGGSGEGEGEKEEERFKSQMKVDIELLREDAMSLGVDVDQMESWKELVEVVNRPSE